MGAFKVGDIVWTKIFTYGFDGDGNYEKYCTDGFITRTVLDVDVVAPNGLHYDYSLSDPNYGSTYCYEYEIYTDGQVKEYHSKGPKIPSDDVIERMVKLSTDYALTETDVNVLSAEGKINYIKEHWYDE